MDDVDKVTRSAQTQIYEVLTTPREKCSEVDEIISNAKQEAIIIVTEVAQHAEATRKEAEKLLENLNKEKQQQMEALNKELSGLE